MPLIATIVTPADALGALAAAIDDAKRHDPLAPVTVAVPTNATGVMARRAMGRSVGIAGVDMVTLNRLAELIAGPALAAADRAPTSTPVIDLAIAAVLARDPGPFRAVATHPSTVVALRRSHEELRLAGPGSLAALEAHSARGRTVARISRELTATLERRWYDEADLFALAAEIVGRGGGPALRPLVVYLPHELPGLARQFVRALAAVVPVEVVVAVTGADDADRDALELLDQLDARERRGSAVTGWPAVTAAPAPVAITSTTDADDEVRHAVRLVVDAARAGTPLERIAVLWPAQQPYARLVEHHLTAAGIPWNGRPGTTDVERLAPRLLLDLLDVDRRGLRRRSLFELLADVPARDADGEFLPTAEWERVSREAGVARDDDWNRRLGALAHSERWGEPAAALAGFVADLRGQLGHPARTRPWAEWTGWCTEQLERWLGRHAIERLPEPDYRAWEALVRALDRLAHLDEIGPPVTRHQFRTTLQAELDARPGRRGRVGDGVTVGPLAAAVGLDIDVAVVLGAAEGLLPPPPTPDPLLSESDRAAAGLTTADARATRLHRLLRAVMATAHTTLTTPRGDLRATSELHMSRWITPWSDLTARVPSHHAGLVSTPFPATSAEHRIRGRFAHVSAGGGLPDAPGVADDTALRRAIELDTARRSDRLTVYDGDLSGAGVPRLDHPVSPSRLESWTACPHAYFARYLLHVRPIEEPDAAISITAVDRGSAQHDALDRFHRAVIAGELPQPGADGWGDVHRAALAAFFDEVCATTERRGRTGRAAFWADERDRMRADLLTWLEHDAEVMRTRGTRVVASEHRFGADDAAALVLPDGREILLTGSIDRVDVTADGTIVVTDHKTGRNHWDKLSADDPTLAGTVFQLPSYAAAARVAFVTASHTASDASSGDGSGDGAPGAVVAEYSLLARGGYKRPGIVIDDGVAELVSVELAAVVDGIESGFFPHTPDKPGWRLYVPCEYCEPDHLGTGDRWGDWERKRHDPRLARWFGDPVDADGEEAGT